MKFVKCYSDKLNETLYCGSHKSGLKVYVMNKTGYSKSYAVFGTHFGSVDNKFTSAGETTPIVLPDGVAHFLEHKLFEQPDGGNVFADYAKYGANANAFTSFNMTAYLFECTANVTENLKILLDFVTKPYFTDENVAKEQGIIGQEIKMYDDDADWRCMINFLSAMYEQNPVKNDIAGSVDSISKIDKELLYKCYRNFYNMSNMVLFVIGDVLPEQVGRCVEEVITDYEILPEKPVRDYGVEPCRVVKNTVKQSLDVSVPTFMFGYKDTDTGYDGEKLLKKNIEYSFIMEIAFGKTSYIYNKLYNEGIIMGFLDYEADCEKDYCFTFVSGESNSPEKVRDVIFKGLEILQEKGISTTDFQRLKKAFFGRFVKQFDNINAIAHGFLSNTFNNIGLFDYIDVIEKISVDDVNNRLRNSFAKELSVLSIIEPVKKVRRFVL